MPPVQMTRAQYQATYGAPPQVPPIPVQPVQTDQTPVTMTRAQYQSTYGQSPDINQSESTNNPFVQAKNEITSNDNRNPLQKGIAATADVFGAVGQLPVLKQIGEVFGKGINIAGEELSKFTSPEFQKSLAELSPEDYNTATQPLKDLQNLGTIANTILMAKGGQKGITKGAEEIKNTVSDLNSFKETPLTPQETQLKLQEVANDWAKPTTINEPKYNNARAVLEEDPEVPKTLSQNGINPFSNIEDGKYNTEDVAQKLRDDNGQLSKDLLRPSLQAEDAKGTIPLTKITDIKPSINDTFGVTADDAEAIQTKLQTKLGALERKYPEGMNLTNLLDERIVYDKNGGYKAFKSNADNIDAIANRAIADTIRDILKVKGESAGIPVSDFQNELAKNYRAADYLDALHGKKAPVSVGQSVARYGAKVLGAKAGGMLGGSDLVSEFVGYHIGGALEKFIENMTNPMRDSFLKNLKITKPEAFTKIEEYLKNNPPK